MRIFDQKKDRWSLHFPLEILTKSAVRRSLHSPFKIWTDSVVRGSLHPLFKIQTDPAVRGSLHSPWKIRTKSAVHGSLQSPFHNLDRFGRLSILASLFLKFGPIRPSVDPCIPFFKIRTKSAIHGSLPPSLKSVLNRWFVDLCITLQKLHQIGVPWISAIPLSKFWTIRPSVDPCIPIFKIRTDSAVRRSLQP